MQSHISGILSRKKEKQKHICLRQLWGEHSIWGHKSYKYSKRAKLFFHFKCVCTCNFLLFKADNRWNGAALFVCSVLISDSVKSIKQFRKAKTAIAFHIENCYFIAKVKKSNTDTEYLTAVTDITGYFYCALFLTSLWQLMMDTTVLQVSWSVQTRPFRW